MPENQRKGLQQEDQRERGRNQENQPEKQQGTTRKSDDTQKGPSRSSK